MTDRTRRNMTAVWKALIYTFWLWLGFNQGVGRSLDVGPQQACKQIIVTYLECNR